MRLVFAVLGLVFLISACVPPSTAPVSKPIVSSPTEWQASRTAISTSTATPLPSRTITPTFTATYIPSSTSTVTITATPVPLPQFNSPLLRPGIQPVSYLTDSCAYLHLRWGEGKAEPGTVVVPVMFHSIVQPPSKVTDPKDITVEEFQAFIEQAISLKFSTITTQELVKFLLYNDYIPPRSMLLIVDDRRPGLIQEHFMPILEMNDWTVTPAYIADPTTMDWAWDWMERLNQTGKLDIQSHGYTGQLYILPDTPLEQIQTEIWESTSVLEARFGNRPIAFVWPGGNFTSTAVQVAREGNYQVGFSAYSRGPLLFNWIPLGEEERMVNDPLMVLPRAWSNSVNYNLYEAIRISEEALSFAESNYQTEAAWLDTYCGGD